MDSTTRSVAFVSLGCAKNLVDSEVMIGKLGSAGWQLVAEPAEADAVVVNTCAFIDPAKAESTDAILEQAAAKRPGQRVERERTIEPSGFMGYLGVKPSGKGTP